MHNWIRAAVVTSSDALVVGMTDGCSKCKPVDFPATAPSLEAMYPECGPSAGGTLVTVEGGSLTYVHTVTINGVSQPILSSDSYSLTFQTAPAPAGTYPVILDYRYDIECKNGKVKETITGSASPGDFEFVDSLVPVVFDAHPELTDPDDYDRLHTEPYEGNCGGGYWIEILGESFVQLETGEEPMVIFDGKELYAPNDVSYDPAIPGVVRVRVPRCPLLCQGTWVPVIVRNPPYHCKLDSGTDDGDTRMEFYYKQEGCVEYDDSLQFGYAEADTGPLYLDTGDILSASSSLKDVAVACERTTDTEGSLVILRGDGNGNITKDDALEFATEGARPTAIALGDFDGNGYADAAVTLNSEAAGVSQIAVFFNAGDGYSNDDAEYIDLGSDLTDLVVADLDADGDDDIAAVSRGTGEVVFLEQTGTRSLDATTMPAVSVPGGATGVSDGPFGIAAGDFDGAGINNDLAVVRHNDTLELFLTSTASEAPVAHADSVSTGAGAIGAASGAFFGGSISGIVVVCADDLTAELYEVSASASISATPTVHALSGEAPTVFSVGVFHGDARTDLAIAHYGGLASGEVEVLELSGAILSEHYSFAVEVQCTDIASDFMNSSDIATREDLVMGLSFSGAFGSVMIAINKGEGFQ